MESITVVGIVIGAMALKGVALFAPCTSLAGWRSDTSGERRANPPCPEQRRGARESCARRALTLALRRRRACRSADCRRVSEGSEKGGETAPEIRPSAPSWGLGRRSGLQSVARGSESGSGRDGRLGVRIRQGGRRWRGSSD